MVGKRRVTDTTSPPMMLLMLDEEEDDEGREGMAAIGKCKGDEGGMKEEQRKKTKEGKKRGQDRGERKMRDKLRESGDTEWKKIEKGREKRLKAK